MEIICLHCKKEIQPDQHRYFSRQAGMRGYYHWTCFIEACHKVNSIGAEKIAPILEEQSPNAYEVFHPADLPTTVLDE
ncbi:MAG: hypothetical protein NTZ18_00005 [Candidatus Komeilibacteria bacterium]|nr:hypothetical protein [Candidatus Komeilibacteria bacterium]